MDPPLRWAGHPATLRRRPYSHTSSIKSIIHGPDIHYIEQELRKLEMEEEELYHGSLRSTPKLPVTSKRFPQDDPSRNNGGGSSLKSSNRGSEVNIKAPLNECLVSGKDLSLVQKKRRQGRPKTCSANFPMRSREDDEELARRLSKGSSDMKIFKTRLSQSRSNGYLQSPPVLNVGENETLANRHEWGIRSTLSFLPDSAKINDDDQLVSKKRIKPRISASAPPGKSSLRTSFSLGNLAAIPRSQSARPVQAFTPASRMSNTVVIGPKRLMLFRPRPSGPTTFRRMYERGDIPVTLQHDYRGQSLRWKVDLEKLDYQQFLPLFFDGLRETKHPYDFFSRAGVRDLLSKGGDRILPLIPQLILPMKNALNTRTPGVVCTVLKVLQELVLSSPGAGEALVPYYRQLLPTLNLFQHRNVNCGDQIDFSQQRRENLGDLIQETLELLERHGGKDAYINIKYMVPTYQSCINC